MENDEEKIPPQPTSAEGAAQLILAELEETKRRLEMANAHITEQAHQLALLQEAGDPASHAWAEQSQRQMDANVRISMLTYALEDVYYKHRPSEYRAFKEACKADKHDETLRAFIATLKPAS